ncbi:hypothetical protein V6N11_026635 [Hibiscus sabdariffa]|uniref:Uncharacterized protein n=1 Tax=Hibiscus sabdariffa TaxID=183260 RepID=A0ABR2SWL4_9ROSI
MNGPRSHGVRFGGLRVRISQNGLRNRTQDVGKHKIGVFGNFDFSGQKVNADVSKVNADVSSQSLLTDDADVTLTSSDKWTGSVASGFGLSLEGSPDLGSKRWARLQGCRLELVMRAWGVAGLVGQCSRKVVGARRGGAWWPRAVVPGSKHARNDGNHTETSQRYQIPTYLSGNGHQMRRKRRNPKLLCFSDEGTNGVGRAA